MSSWLSRRANPVSTADMLDSVSTVFIVTGMSMQRRLVEDGQTNRHVTIAYTALA